LSAQWYDGDPFNGGNFIADALDTNAAYSATVSSSATPEPALFPVVVLVLAVLLAIRIWPRMKKKRAIAAGALIAIISGTTGAQTGVPQEESKESGITRQQADDILLELRAIHQLLDRQVRPAAPQ